MKRILLLLVIAAAAAVIAALIGVRQEEMRQVVVEGAPGAGAAWADKIPGIRRLGPVPNWPAEVWELPSREQANLAQVTRAAGVVVHDAGAVPLWLPRAGATTSDSQGPLVVNWTRITAFASQPGIRLIITLPDLGRIDLGPFRIRGDVLSARAGRGEISLVSVGDGVYGTVRSGGRVFELLRTTGADYSLTEVPLPYEPDIVRRLAVARSLATGKTECESENQLTAAVGFTPEVLAHQPSVATTKIPAAEALLNDALIDVGTPLRFVFTAVATSDSESGNISNDLAKLTTIGDGHWDSLATRSEDLVVLLVKEATASGIATVGSSPTQRFAVVKVDKIASLSLSHEVGHLASGDHEREVSTNPLFAFGHAFWVNKEYRTIIGTGGACPDGCDRVNAYSNPLATVYGHEAGDAAFADVARVLNTTLPAINEYSCRSTTLRTLRAGIHPGSRVDPTPSR